MSWQYLRKASADIGRRHVTIRREQPIISSSNLIVVFMKITDLGTSSVFSDLGTVVFTFLVISS